MGGASKKPISTVEKRMKKMAEEQQKKQQKRATTKTGKELTSKNVVIDNETLKKVQEELKKETIVTPYTLSTKLNVTISVAKKILEELERQGVVKIGTKDRRTAVYIAAS
ncbi:MULTISPECIES: 30S ribosomal protein S25e [Sulfurisphaera]|uniref:Small ribosomal subunit protein eS25 n=3 Tax=Sulfurisphaera TaxID=69655 RepID=RS25_SULTO|nr:MULTISPECIES: 30S ribosomal protein S25e [Sulfurisphaera]Q975P8.1 RecName: Full=Small ribosomal subunit protein eS25; AltName: Full=30S ribosomal protein S25e [Sulfurisphaera tokodaii str. 7]MBB5253057.1 small subunit ribosomal protein S25e [Sulfurisphaera ohwakuensis]QGR16020.1 30S ribosomal protein S25e [Sulfurisphaera ohwakuensis]BAB65352.1 30S ribosomal protein S25e [Sulfurisphaera tokodaii str. 7]HII74948.1 30S ribosomal protein S25e [Sulfurisphaera tokodaii]